MSTFNVPKKEEVSEGNQTIFTQLESKLGFVPNLFATFAYSKNALANYLALSGAKVAFSIKEKEVINLVVSQINECEYCLAAHTAIGEMNGFTDAEVLELRKGSASFNLKYDALAKLVKSMVKNRGGAEDVFIDAFFNAGYTKEHLADVVVLVGEITMTNYLHRTTKVAVDFPKVAVNV